MFTSAARNTDAETSSDTLFGGGNETIGAGAGVDGAGGTTVSVACGELACPELVEVVEVVGSGRGVSREKVDDASGTTTLVPPKNVPNNTPSIRPTTMPR